MVLAPCILSCPQNSQYFIGAAVHQAELIHHSIHWLPYFNLTAPTSCPAAQICVFASKCPARYLCSSTGIIWTAMYNGFFEDIAISLQIHKTSSYHMESSFSHFMCSRLPIALGHFRGQVSACNRWGHFLTLLDFIFSLHIHSGQCLAVPPKRSVGISCLDVTFAAEVAEVLGTERQSAAGAISKCNSEASQFALFQVSSARFFLSWGYRLSRLDFQFTIPRTAH
jgi:hypothetical protein